MNTSLRAATKPPATEPLARRRAVWLLVLVIGLPVCTSCGLDPSTEILGRWADPSGRTMVFDANGRVVIRDPNRETMDCTYTYAPGLRRITIALPNGAGTLQGELLTKTRLRIGGSGGRPFIFNKRRG